MSNINIGSYIQLNKEGTIHKVYKIVPADMTGFGQPCAAVRYLVPVKGLVRVLTNNMFTLIADAKHDHCHINIITEQLVADFKE